MCKDPGAGICQGDLENTLLSAGSGGIGGDKEVRKGRERR